MWSGCARWSFDFGGGGRMYPRIFSLLLNEPWLIQPAAHNGLIEALCAHIERGGDQVDERIPDSMRDQHGTAQPVRHFENRGGVAHVEASGVLGRKLSIFERMCGGCDVNFLQHAITRAAEDPDVHTILVDIDSPGGMVTGTPETARLIRQVNDSGTPVITYTETYAASGGQWIHAAGGYALATPSAIMGSIGVYRYFLDHTRALVESGSDPVVVTAGKFKALGLPGRGVTEEDLEQMQTEVDAVHADFKAAIREMREGHEIADEHMEGQTLKGTQALAAGLIDGMVDTFDEALEAARAGV